MQTMTISRAGDAYAIAFPYDPALVAAVKQLPNRKWNASSKLWMVPKSSGHILQQLVSEVRASGSVSIDPAIEQEIAAQQQQAALAIEASRAEDVNANIPAPEGLAYMPFQRAGIAYANGRKNVLIADDMGLGKTIQAIGVSNADDSARSVLVLCPSSLRLNWGREWKKWCVKGLSVGVYQTGAKTLPQTDVVILNYDNLKKFIAAIHARSWDILVCDEAHALKNPKTQRTKLVLGAKKEQVAAIGARRKVFLTGTPILNRPIELWPLANALAPDVFSSWSNYVFRYCAAYNSRYGLDVTGSSNLDELQNVLRANFMVRRLKKDVLTELPAKQRQVIELPCEDKSVTRERNAAAAIESRLEALRVNVELAKCGSDDEYETAVDALREGASAAFAEMAVLRHETALAKVPAVIEHLTEAVESGKVICFAHHRDVIRAIVDAFPGCVVVTGETSLNDRQAAVDKFQGDPACRLFVGNIQAAGVGLTLTASSHVVFAELDWTPAMISQAEDRAHRIGQRDSVLVQHLVLEESLDAHMAKQLVAKQKVLDDALDNRHEARELLDEPMLPVVTEEAATQSVSRKAVAEQAESISSEEAAEIHGKLRVLAAMCDGASSRDGSGFNKFDVAIGMSLAGSARLSAKQTVLGRKLVHKYRRQLAV